MRQLKKRNKMVDNALHNINQMVEQWKNRLTLNNLRLTERYLEGSMERVLHLRGDIAGHPNDFCAILRYDSSARLAGAEIDADGSGLRRRWVRAKNNSSVRCGIQQDKQEAMFAEIVKFLESPE